MTSKPTRCPACHRRFKRSNPQNSLYWTLLHAAAARLKPQGVSYSPDSYHLYFKSRYLGAEDVPLPNGKTMVVPHSTADLDVTEFSDYYTKVEADLAERGIYLEDLAA